MTGWAKWENLPQRLLGFDEKVNESVCLCAQVADAVSAWKGRGVQQDAAGSRKCHVCGNRSVQTLSRLFGLAICFWGEDLPGLGGRMAAALSCKHSI